MEKTRGIQLRPNPLRANTPAAYGQVLANGKYSKGINLQTWTCDVRSWSGEILTNVRMPGAYFDIKGNGHGKLGGISENQLVLVDFGFGSSQNPIIVEAYPYFAQDKDSENFNLFLKKKKIKKDDIVMFHSSGYSVWMRKMRIELYLDTNPVPLAFIDLTTNTFSVNMNIAFGPVGTTSVPNGELLLADLTARANFESQTKAAIDLIKTALSTSMTTSGDGGATYKAGVVAGLAALVSPTPVTPNPQILKTNLKITAT